MQRILHVLGCMLLVAFTGSMNVFAQKSGTVQTQYVEGVVRVKLQREVAARVASQPEAQSGGRRVRMGIRQLDDAAEKVGAVSMQRVFPYAGKDEEKHRQYGLDLWYDIKYDTREMSTLQVRNLYKTMPGVEKAQPVPIYRLLDDGKCVTLTAQELEKAQKARRAPVPEMPFNDPMLSQQWHYHNYGAYSGMTKGVDINLFKAWESGVYGKKDVLVAIIDGGFEVTHPDLKDNLWINEAELNGKAGVDDDGNGFVDDVYGYNFVVNSANINSHEHGTHVAGTVGATNGNGIGVCGVAGGKDGKGGVKMMVCQVFDGRATNNMESNYGAALVYAADCGAAIAQCSWGYSDPSMRDDALEEAVHYFTREGGGKVMNGGLCIFASGNNGDTGNYFPGCLDDVVAVGAMDAAGYVTSYSNYGEWVDVTAPGGDLNNGTYFGILSTLPNGTYGYFEGTSMACPHVSGVAALILSKYGNKDFSNETLRTLLTTSVNDLYTRNPGYVGLMGSGYIDAYKALQGKEGSTPDGVKEFRLTPSHDNILIEWTIPDCEEKSIDHHVVYYSTEPFDAASDLSKVNRVSVDTKFRNSGDAVSYELTGMKASTTYYIALVAYSRWGKASQLSPILKATTNAGPKALVDKTALTMVVDAQKSPVAQTEFNVQNVGEGMLKYALTTATAKAQYATQSLTQHPLPGQTVPFSGAMRAERAERHEVVSADYEAADYPQQITFGQTIYAYLGETDKNCPNAQAQYLWVDPNLYPEGFNLTHLSIQGSHGENPEIAIYDGSRAINVASLLQKVEYKSFKYGSELALNEQIHFAPNTGFWVVVKFKPGYVNPLGASMTDGTDYSHFSFYSSDNGVTWTQLSEVLKGSSFESVANNLTWAINAISKNPDWSAVLNPQPLEGEVRPGQQQTVTLQNDGQQLVNGTYTFHIHVRTNEAEESHQQVALTLKVSGYQPRMHAPKLVDFGSLLVGQSKTVEVELVNSGFGAFTGTNGSSLSTSKNIRITSPHFKAEKGCPAVPARSSKTMHLSFAPNEAGNFSTTVTLTDKNGNSCSFLATGVASAPAQLAVEQDELDLGSLNEGEEKTATLTLKNVGKYPLQFVFPKFSDEQVEGSTAQVHKFGYTLLSNVAGAKELAYQAMPELADEMDITRQFSDNTWFSQPIDLGFKFPFYGQDYEQVYVCSYGGVAMQPLEEETHFACTVPSATCVEGVGYISAFANSGWLTMGTSSKVSTGHKDGRLYVRFQNVQCPNYDGSGLQTVSFHLVLCPDGSVEVYYDDYQPERVFGSGTNNFVGVSDILCLDPCTFVDVHSHVGNSWEISYYDIKSQSAIRMVAPARSMISSLSETDGYIGIGESRDVTVCVRANENLFAGELVNYLTVITNDPLHPSHNITLKANIQGEGLQPVARLEETEVDFGQVFRTSQQRHTLLLHNTGRSMLTVSRVQVKGGRFSVADEVKDGLQVPAAQSRDIVVTLPTETEGRVEDVLVITYADGTAQEVVLKGEVIGVPTMALNPTSIQAETPYGVNAVTQLKVDNSGSEALEFTPQPEAWYSLSDLEADDQQARVDYVYKTLTDGDAVTYDWKDITEDYTDRMPFSYFIDKTDFKKVTLPFDFPFYGKKYREMWIYNTGFVSFDAPIEDYKQFPEPPVTLPSQETFYTNIICPFWGHHTMNTSSTDGVYYKEMPDEVIVSFKGYGNSMMMYMNFQLILRKDGSFKFQYKLDETGFMLGVFGLAGVMDHTATRGVVTPSAAIATGNAIEFMPVKTYKVEGGNSVLVPLELHADQLADTYTYALNLNTNVPGREKVSVPVTLNITGQPEPVFPETLDIEQPYDLEGNYMAYPFTVENKGTKAFTIIKIASKLFNFGDEDIPAATLEVYAPYNGGGVDPLANDDEVYMAWIPYLYMTDPIVVAQEPVKFRITVYDNARVHQETCPMTFTVKGLSQKTVTTTINLNITEAPVLAFDQDELCIQGVAKDYKGNATLNLMNQGAYKLTYDLQLDPSGRDASLEVSDEDYGYGGVDPLVRRMARAFRGQQVQETLEQSTFVQEGKKVRKALGLAAKANVKDDQKYIYDVPQNSEGKNLLYHPVLNPVSNAIAAVMGTGNSHLDEHYYAATRYEAPQEGFNLTHLYFVGTVGTLENVDIEASVILGSDVTATNRTIGQGKVHVKSEEPGNAGYIGVPRVLTFDNPVFINPNDTFYVVLKYPAGYSASALMASKDGAKERNRYMANSKALGGWLDIEETFDVYYSYGSFGYFMTCVEWEKGEPWIKMLGEQTTGEIAPGASLPLNFQINAAQSYFEKNNTATLVVRSNDPQRKLVNYHIRLDKNGAPAITPPEGTVTVPEAGKAVVSIPVEDVEGDAFSVSFQGEKGISAVESYCNEAGTQEGISLEQDTYRVEAGKSLTLNVALTPDYGTAGYHSFQVTAKDASGQRVAVVNYNVEHTNRAPLFVGKPEMLIMEKDMENLLYADLFQDPDGDSFVCEVENGNDNVVELFFSPSGVVVRGKAVGTSVLTLTAKDANGAATQVELTVTVADPTAIVAVREADNVTLEAGTEGVTVTFGTSAQQAILNVYDNAGQLLARKVQKEVRRGDKVDVELPRTAVGVHHLVLNMDGKATTLKFLKK